MKKLCITSVLIVFYFFISAQVNVNIKVFLEGPFVNDQMTTFLNVQGYLPLDQPYDTVPWNYSGNESVNSIPSNNIVDWVLVDILKPAGDSINQSFDIITRKAGFVLSDGIITDLDGISHLGFSIGNIEEFYVKINHRNHLSVISSTPLSENNDVFTYNFTTDAAKALGGMHSQKQVETGIWSMYAADGNSSNQIDNKDKNEVWEPQQDSIGYYNGDFNLSTQVDINDKDVTWKQNVGKGIQYSIFTCGDSIVDVRDSKVYNTILIGEQCWLGKNLDYETTNSKCLDNYPPNCEYYGGLYNWETIMMGSSSSNAVPSGVKGICPSGWPLTK